MSGLPDGRRLGAHLPLATGMVKAVERAGQIGASAMQIFADNPTAWRRRAEPPRELTAFRHRLRELDIAPVSIHASYLVNLAGSNEESFERSIVLLAHELRNAPTFGARFVNVHIGSHLGLGVRAGIDRLAEGILRTIRAADRLATPEHGHAAGRPPVTAHADATEAGAAQPEAAQPEAAQPEAAQPEAAQPEAAQVEAAQVEAAQVEAAEASRPPMLVLENSAGSGGGLGTSVGELADIAAAIARLGVAEDRVGFCIDTAHAWGAGIDVATPAGVDDLVAAFDDRIGLERLVLVHLNDSRSERGSRTDRHEHVGAGRIGPVGLAHVLRHPRLAHATYLLETPGMDEGYDAINMARARALAEDLPLEPLPAAAFQLRGSARARTAPA